MPEPTTATWAHPVPPESLPPLDPVSLEDILSANNISIGRGPAYHFGPVGFEGLDTESLPGSRSSENRLAFAGESEAPRACVQFAGLTFHVGLEVESGLLEIWHEEYSLAGVGDSYFAALRDLLDSAAVMFEATMYEPIDQMDAGALAFRDVLFTLRPFMTGDDA